MKKLLVILSVFLLSIGTLFAYSLTEKDDKVIDKIESRLIDKIDNNDRLTPEIVVSYIYKILEKKKLSQRVEAILEVIADDIEYVYGIGLYAQDSSWFVMTADDCYEDEYFDTDTQQCIFDDSSYDESNDNVEYEVWDLSHDNESHGESKILAWYKVSGDSISLIDWQDSVKAKQVWEAFSTLIPLSARWDFHKYFVVDDENSDTAAHVEQDSDDNTKWNMTVNLDSVYVDGEIDSEWYATLIHEFAHVLTLNKTQVRYVPVTDNEDILQRFEQNCQWNFLQEWCLDEDAYLDDFIDIFWPDPVYLEKVRNEEINAYDGNESKFITDYAATNPWEDIAESFTYFVLKTKQTSDTVANKKLNFFYSYPALDTLRKQIRIRLEKLQ